uniref:caveolin-3-like n=1 Tax=Styela clava TaxID=7725 RepID=UPI00193AA3FB|nr:caveolin-3-like [Styela clava]
MQDPRADLDMVNRDPKNINESIKVLFEDVIAEPEGSHSIDAVWMCSNSTFWGLKNGCYIFLSVLCGGPCACVWGLVFACQSFYSIWCVRPCCKMYEIYVDCCMNLWRITVSCCFYPICDAFSRIFSNIKFQHRYEVV